MDNNDRERVCDLLNDLIKLDYDAIEAYEAAVKRTDDQTIRSQMQSAMTQAKAQIMDEVGRS